MSTDNIIVLDSYFNLTNNLMSLTGFNTIFWLFDSGLLFWATLYGITVMRKKHS